MYDLQPLRPQDGRHALAYAAEKGHEQAMEAVLSCMQARA
jgi:hypothetical protein